MSEEVRNWKVASSNELEEYNRSSLDMEARITPDQVGEMLTRDTKEWMDLKDAPVA